MPRTWLLVVLVVTVLVSGSCTRTYDLYVANPCDGELSVAVKTNGSGEWTGDVKALSIKHIADVLAAPPELLELEELALAIELGPSTLVVGDEKAYHVVIPGDACP